MESVEVDLESTSGGIVKKKGRHMEIREILKQVKTGEMSVKEAEQYLRREPFEEMGYAKLDVHRKLRSGFAEVVFCSGKADEHLLHIYQKLYEEEGEVFGTRASKEQYELIRTVLPQIEYDAISRILKLEKKGKKRIGKIAVCTAGTADIPVAEEAALTAEFFGDKVDRVYDVGVAGIHRLFGKIDRIQSADVIIVIAGMEGALASVVGGLVEVPVIAVPTSVGYGASFGGLAALLSMLNSCAHGIGVVNIDNGYGAACLANKIMKR